MGSRDGISGIRRDGICLSPGCLCQPVTEGTVQDKLPLNERVRAYRTGVSFMYTVFLGLFLLNPGTINHLPTTNTTADKLPLIGKQNEGDTRFTLGNSPDTAARIQLNKLYQGVLFADGDEGDFFRFSACTGSPLALEVTHGKSTGSPIKFALRRADQGLFGNRAEVFAYVNPGEAKTISLAEAPACDLIFSVTNDGQDHSYSFKVIGEA
ncbi:MAG TPA: hypothetical protein PLB18_11230 [Acidobacteriota bacterium]|nr:hypothetical protein [Acidobacteriota bacterium]HNG91792.1 hypothetical protein [Acidobacteriota bacterium]